MDIVTKCVNPWLQQRKAILTSLHKLAGLLPKNVYRSEVSLTRFFQLLIDYLCAGHLQIFMLFIKKYVDHPWETKEILMKIQDNTNNIIKYNQKFNRLKNISACDVIALLEQFINRIELEDLLLKMSSQHLDYINLPKKKDLN